MDLLGSANRKHHQTAGAMIDQAYVPAKISARAAQFAVRWLQQRPFILGPWAWYTLTLALIVAGGCVALTGAGPWWAGAAPAALSIFPAVPSRVWARLRRRASHGLAVVARFGDENDAHGTVAAVHIQELVRRLKQQPALREHLDIRVVNAAVTEKHAARIMRWTRARALVSGSGLLIGDRARWEAWMLVRWGQLNAFEDRSPSGAFVMRAAAFRRTAASKVRLATDAEFPVSKLTAEKFPADHADGVEATLLTVVERRDAQTAAATLIDAMPTEVRAVYENGRAMDLLERTGDLVAAYKYLENQGDSGADDVLLWNQCLTLITWAEQQDLVSPSERLRIGKRALETAPRNGVTNAQVGVAYLALGRPEQAREHFELALQDDDAPIGQQFLFEMLARAYAALGDHDAEVTALTHAWAKTPLGRWRVRRIIRRVDQEQRGDSQAPSGSNDSG